MMHNTLKISALLFLSMAAGNSFAQECHNLYPYADGVVYDNNGHDLNGFIKKNKTEAAYVGGKIDEFSGGNWGYIQVNNARVPSISVIPGKERKVVLSYSQIIDATVAITNTKDGLKGTWWTRQSNNPSGPLFYKKVNDEGRLEIPNIRYSDFFKELDIKKMTIVEHYDTTYNQRDYDQLLHNYILVEKGTVKDVNDYKSIIEFYNNFLSKFTNIDDPLLETKSFITFLTVNKTRYLGYFNIVNGKLAGHMELTDLQFEQDKDFLVNNTFKKLTGKTVYVFGDDIFGCEKNLLKYKHMHHGVEMIRNKTDATEKFK